MTRPDDRGRLVLHGVLAAGAILVPVLLGAAVDWPPVVVVPLVAVLLVAVGLSARRALSRPASSPPDYWPRPADEHRARTDNSTLGTAAVGPVLVPSGTTNYRFELSATAHWRVLPGGRQWDRTVLTARAREAVVHRAVAVTERMPAVDGTLAEYRLASVLSTPEADRERVIEVWATDATITIGDGDRARLHALAEMAKDRDVTESERNRERDLRAYLGSEVLTSTGSALVWWLARHIDQIDGAVERIPTLARISTVAQDKEEVVDLPPVVDDVATTAAAEEPDDEDPDDIPTAPGGTPSTGVLEVIASLFPDDDAARRRAARQVAALAEHWGRPGFAETVRREADEGPQDREDRENTEGPSSTADAPSTNDVPDAPYDGGPDAGGSTPGDNGSGNQADVDPRQSWTPPEE